MAGGNWQVAVPSDVSLNLAGTTRQLSLKTLDLSELIGGCRMATTATQGVFEDNGAATLLQVGVLAPKIGESMLHDVTAERTVVPMLEQITFGNREGFELVCRLLIRLDSWTLSQKQNTEKWLRPSRTIENAAARGSGGLNSLSSIFQLVSPVQSDREVRFAHVSKASSPREDCGRRICLPVPKCTAGSLLPENHALHSGRLCDFSNRVLAIGVPPEHSSNHW